MNPIRTATSFFILLFLLLLTGVSNAQEVGKPNVVKIGELSWLAGNWTSDTNGTITEEQWLEPLAGMMIGMNREVSRNGRASFEFFRIAETDKGLVYYASPSGKPATPFTLKELKSTRVIFENNANDFPQRIIYDRSGDTMVAMIEGEIKGKAESMKWIWKRKP